MKSEILLLYLLIKVGVDSIDKGDPFLGELSGDFMAARTLMLFFGEIRLVMLFLNKNVNSSW